MDAENASKDASGGRKTATRIKEKEPIQTRILIMGMKPLMVIRCFVVLSAQTEKSSEMMRRKK